MKKPSFFQTRGRRRAFIFLGAVAALLLAVLVLPAVVAHWAPPFTPDYDRVDLTAIVSKETRSSEDYHVIFLQTGLAKPAVDSLLARGEAGAAQIFETQEAFFRPVKMVCTPLAWPLVMEDRLVDGQGERAQGPAIPVLEEGDVLLTLSTHSLGWRHGHGGLVMDATAGLSLEAAVIGQDSALMDVSHWRSYSNFMVLRLRDMTPQLQRELTDYAAQALTGVPYHLTSGFLGPKAPDAASPSFGVQCSYLVWYAFQHFGYDLDSDGGRLVSVNDLAESPLFEVVQVYGLDPRDWIR